MKTYASIYIASYGITMNVYEISRGKKLKEIDHLYMPLPIVQELSKNGELSADLISRIIRVLRDLTERAKAYRADEIQVMASNALTRFKNRFFVFEQIRIRTGISLQILSNSEQRFLEYEAIAEMDAFEEIIRDETILVDFGGVSVQMTLFSRGSVVTTQHLSLGSFTLRENYRRIQNVPDHREQITEMIDKEIDVFQKMYLKNRAIKNLILVDDADDRREEINTNQMVQQELLKMIPAEQVIRPTRDVNLGMALDYAYRNRLLKPTHDFHEDILSAAWFIAERYGCYHPHLKAMHEMSLEIFDAMKKYHGLGQRERILMEVSAILHDCGKYISIYDSAVSSHRIILSSEILGLTHKEREIIAAVAMYNRMEVPDYEELRMDFTPDEYWTMLKLLAILKVSNALDRSHKQKMKHVSIRVRDDELVIGVESNNSMALEKGMFQSKADFFYQVFAIRPVIREKTR